MIVLVISASRGVNKLNPFGNRLRRRRERGNKSIEGKLHVAISLLEEGAGSSRLDTIAMLVKHFFERYQIVFIAHCHKLAFGTAAACGRPSVAMCTSSTNDNVFKRACVKLGARKS